MNNSKKQIILWSYDSILKPAMYNTMRFFAHHDQYFFTHVTGYPKSGTTWVSQMIAHYMRLPLIIGASISLGFKCVIHHHWDYHPALDNSIFIIRDGRDVMVSIYMNLMKAYSERREAISGLSNRSPVRVLVNNIGVQASRDKRYRYLFGSRFDPYETEKNLPVFIEAELQKPFISAVKFPWHEHIGTWRSQAKNTIFVKYEDFLRDPQKTMNTTLSKFLNTAPSDEEIAYTVNRYTFKNMTGRNPGQENRKAFARKGIHGDWRNYFSQEAKQVFDYYAGDTLIELGYEPNNNWVHDSDNSLIE